MEISRRFDAKTRITRSFASVIFAFVVALFLWIPTAGTQHPPHSLTLSTFIHCPAYPVSGKSPVTLHGYVVGTNDKDRLKDIVFNWAVSNASIISGQGSRTIVLDPSVKSGVSEIKVNLEIDKGPPSLVYQASCVLAVDSQCSPARMVDQYSAVSADEERQHLNRLAQRLKTDASQSIAYIVSYAGQRACVNEADWRAKLARKYLIETHSIPNSRIVMVEGGFRENWTVELYLKSPQDCGPIPKPTLIDTQAQVRVIGFCDESPWP